MSEVIDAPAPTVAPAVAAPAVAPAAAAPAVAPAPRESLFSAAPAPTAAAEPAPAAAPAAADPWAKVPEKYQVKGADGALDQVQTLAKLTDGYAAAVKRIGSGDIPPADPTKYTFTPPEEFKDVKLDDELAAGFRDRAHKAGLTQSQFDFVMGEYFRVVPSVIDAGATHTAQTARDALGQVWTTPAAMQEGLDAGQRAMVALPDALRQQAIDAGLGVNPVFAQVVAHFGRAMREDRPPSQPASSAAPTDLQQLMAHPAWRDQRHPEHAAISARVVAIQRQRFGDSPA